MYGWEDKKKKKGYVWLERLKKRQITFKVMYGWEDKKKKRLCMVGKIEKKWMIENVI